MNGHVPYEDLEIFFCQDEEIEGVERLMAESLNIPLGRVKHCMGLAGQGGIRVLRHGGQVPAALAVIPDAQFFNGKAVGTGAVAFVAVAPHWRGRGLGRGLMRRLLEELYADDIPLSVLYPSSWAFYRSVGFERAGECHHYQAATAQFRRPRVGGCVIEHVGSPGIEGEATEAYRHAVCGGLGPLTRENRYFTERIFRDPDAEVYSYGVRSGGKLVGHVSFTHDRPSATLVVRDFIAGSRVAAEELVWLIGSHGSIFESVVWCGAANHPLTAMVGDRFYEVTKPMDWMLRVVDVEPALARRGWPVGVSGRLELEVVDDVLDWNNGRWVLDVVDGVGTVTRGGAGSLRLSVLDLAALYTGYRSAREQARWGTLEGPPEVLAVASLLFGGGRPWLADRF